MLRSTTPNSGDFSPHSEGSDIEALRDQISELSTEVSRIVAGRVEAAKRATEAGTEYARETVDEYPLSSLALAFGVGALVGLAIIPSRRSSFDWHNPNLSHARGDLADFTDKMKRSIAKSASGRGLMSNFERVADTVSSVDAKATIGPVWNRLLSWLDDAKVRASASADEIKKVL